MDMPRKPYMLISPDGQPRDYTFTEIHQYGNSFANVPYDSYSELLDAFYERRSTEARMKAKSSNLSKTLKTLRERAARRLDAQMTELMASRNREPLRECGDILMANIGKIRPGAAEAVLPDFYNGGERAIKLDVRKNAQQNAQKYYKDYTKAKNAEKILTDLITAAERDIDYFDSALVMLELAESDTELADIRIELENAGYLKKPKTKQKTKPTKPRQFTAPSGAQVLAGRNNTQNSELTFKTAFGTDLWLHIQKRHGSHVILRSGSSPPEDRDIEFAAAAAAYYSEARNDNRAAVDYCLAKYVKKIPGAKPGMVIYSEYKTVIVIPKPPE